MNESPALTGRAFFLAHVLPGQAQTRCQENVENIPYPRKLSNVIHRSLSQNDQKHKGLEPYQKLSTKLYMPDRS
jgi:hypothetical protein